VRVGASRSFSYVVRNAGGGLLIGSASTPCAVFDAAPATFELGAGQASEIVVTFAPPSVGDFSCTLAISSNGGMAEREVVGNGVVPPPIPVVPSPTSAAGIAMVFLLALAIGRHLRLRPLR
jgi:hypothetical protein